MAQIPNYRSASLLYAYKRIRITEVDTQNGYVEGTDSSKQNIKISFKWFYQPFLAVPEVGEDWLVFKMDTSKELIAQSRILKYHSSGFINHF